jgi:hypothetical protein
MGKPEEELREAYYIRCRTKGYSIDESSKRSQTYIKHTSNKTQRQ